MDSAGVSGREGLWHLLRPEVAEHGGDPFGGELQDVSPAVSEAAETDPAVSFEDVEICRPSR